MPATPKNSQKTKASIVEGLIEEDYKKHNTQCTSRELLTHWCPATKDVELVCVLCQPKACVCNVCEDECTHETHA